MHLRRPNCGWCERTPPTSPGQAASLGHGTSFGRTPANRCTTTPIVFHRFRPTRYPWLRKRPGRQQPVPHLRRNARTFPGTFARYSPKTRNSSRAAATTQLKRWLNDHPDHAAVPGNVKIGLANVKNVLRHKKRKNKKEKAAQVGATPARVAARPKSPRADLALNHRA